MRNSLITSKFLSKNTIHTKNKNIPIVFIHGWGLNSKIWQPTIEKLQQSFDVITIDLPGFGLNIDHQLDDYSLSNVVNEINQAIDTPAIYVGWSLGGLVATQLALSYPNKVLACVTVASSPCFLNNTSNHIQWPGILPNVLKMFYQQLAEDTQKTVDGFLKIQAMGSPNIRQDIKTIKKLVMQHSVPSEQTLSDSLRLLETIDLRAKLSDLTQPLLRIYGKLDALIPKAVITQIDNLAPNSEKYIFEKASHAPFISHPDEFNDVLLTWCKKIVFSESN